MKRDRINITIPQDVLNRVRTTIPSGQFSATMVRLLETWLDAGCPKMYAVQPLPVSVSPEWEEENSRWDDRP